MFVSPVRKLSMYALLTSLVILHLYNYFDDGTFFTALTVAFVFILIVNFLVNDNSPTILNSSKYIKLLNTVSTGIAVIAYIILYMVEKNNSLKLIPIIPIGMLVIIEGCILYLIWKGNNDIQREYSQHVLQSRIMSAFCILVIFIMCIVHYFELITDVVLYTTVLCVYVIGAIYVAVNKYDVLNWSIRKRSYKKLIKPQKLSEEEQ